MPERTGGLLVDETELALAGDGFGPAFIRRREIGGASARSLLLTILGEFVLPQGEPVWTATLLEVLGLLGVEQKAARQALMRTAREGWIETERQGRRAVWRVTPKGDGLLAEGGQRIYTLGRSKRDWDGRWLVVLVNVPDSSRQLRHRLRTRLEWSGFGSLAPGTWTSPHVDRESELHAVLAELELLDEAIVFVAELGELGDPQRIAQRAWRLDELDARYQEFLAAVADLRPVSDDETLLAQIRLVQEWRRFPFLDPDLPVELLPEDWRGHVAAALFAERHQRWKRLADRRWRALVAAV